MKIIHCIFLLQYTWIFFLSNFSQLSNPHSPPSLPLAYQSYSTWVESKNYFLDLVYAFYLKELMNTKPQTAEQKKEEIIIFEKVFCENSQRVEAVGYFRGRTLSWMLGRILKATLTNNLSQIEEGLRKSFPPLGLHKRIWYLPASLFS